MYELFPVAMFRLFRPEYFLHVAAIVHEFFRVYF
jgi:hypothetical protein